MQPILNFQAPNPFPAVGNQWIIQNLYHSTMEDYNKLAFRGNAAHPHFIRDSTRRVVAYLNQQFIAYNQCLTQYNNALVSGGPNPTHIPYAHINGAPSGGKSSEVFGWLQYQPGGKLFLHSSNRGGNVNVVHLDSTPGVNQNSNGERISIDTVSTFLADLNNDVNILVIDGAFDAHLISSFISIAKERLCFLVSCVSGQSEPSNTAMLTSFLAGFDPDDAARRISSLVVNGFTLEEYGAASAIVQPQFPDTIELLRSERFYYAGGSSRFYYGYAAAEDIALAIDTKISKIKNFNNLFSGQVCGGSTVAVNSLRTFVNGKATIVSEYATKQLSTHVEHSFIFAVENILPHNPVWLEWVAELDLLERIRRCATVSENITWEVRLLGHLGKPTIAWRVNLDGVIEYTNPLVDLPAFQPTFAEINANIQKTYLFIPTRWNNWGFDAVLVFFRRHQRIAITPYIKIIQCTLAREQRKLLGQIALFMRGLFPWNSATNHYGQANQMQFRRPNIEYSVLTRKATFLDHDLNLGDVSGRPQIRVWDPAFDIPENAAKYYFDEDCEYKKSENYYRKY